MRYTLLVLPFFMAGPVFAAPERLSDGQIVEVLETVNEGEIDAATIARDRAQNPAVQQFAKDMQAQHQTNKKDTKELAKQNKIDDKDSGLADALEKEADALNKTLKRAQLNGFDKVYMAQQVAMHEKALSTLRDNLIPFAQSDALKTHLEKTAAAVAMHLEHAKKLQSELK